MLENLTSLGYNSMTPIQAQALPVILEHKDLTAQAKTGSGKTAAFGIGLLHKLKVEQFRVQSLVLCPTRELADQVAKELRRIAKFAHNIKILTLCGGESFGKQAHSLSHQAHIIVGTPGRILKHLNKQTLELTHLQTLVLDEADRMLDMGFIEEITSVVAFAPKERQTLLFSATFDDEVLEVANNFLQDATFVEVVSQEQKAQIEELFFKCEDKDATLLKLLAKYNPSSVMIFANTKIKTQEIAQYLQEHKVDALALHGDLEQYERNDVLVQFANHSTPVLVATDVASRGLDIKALPMVINYDLPHQQESYTHRIGRTARAGEKGMALSLFADENELELFEMPPSTQDGEALDEVKAFEMKPAFVTLVIEGGKKNKLRAGDIVGALMGGAGVAFEEIGKIDIYEKQSYVAIASSAIDKAYKGLKNNTIKKRKFSVWVL